VYSLECTEVPKELMSHHGGDVSRTIEGITNATIVSKVIIEPMQSEVIVSAV
jgi:hypothetical protein